MRLAAALSVLLFAPNLVGAPVVDKKVCFKLAEDGQDLRSDGKLLDARAKFLECARAACPDYVKKDCSQWLDEVEAALPTVVVRAKKGDADVPIARVRVDGVEVAGYVDGKPFRLDPGTRKIAIEPKGEPSTEGSFIVVAGEKNRLIVFTLVSPTLDKPPPDDGPKPSTPEAPVWPWVVSGVGVVALSGFAWFAVTGMRDVRRLEDRGCAPRCPDADVNAIRTKLLVADVALGVSVVAFAVATYGFLSAPSSNDAKKVSIGLGPGVAFVQGSF